MFLAHNWSQIVEAENSNPCLYIRIGCLLCMTSQSTTLRFNHPIKSLQVWREGLPNNIYRQNDENLGTNK